MKLFNPLMLFLFKDIFRKFSIDQIFQTFNFDKQSPRPSCIGGGEETRGIKTLFEIQFDIFFWCR